MNDKTNLFDRSEHGKAKVGLACFPGRDTSNHVGTVRKGLLDMESTLSRSKIQQTICLDGSSLTYRLAREPLANDSGVLSNKKILDGIGVTCSGSRLSERPASGWQRNKLIFSLIKARAYTEQLHANDCPARRSITCVSDVQSRAPSLAVFIFRLPGLSNQTLD